MKSHRLIDERSLAFDRLIAAKLRVDPALADQARANLKRWMQTAAPGSQPALLEWMAILDGPAEDILAMLEGTHERATCLRQSSPFCGMLTADERTAILPQFQARESVPA